MTLKREGLLAEAAKSDFDLIVIGGGITGASILRDASRRGLSCLLLEKSDFASGTSSRSGKLIHGGLRYLRHFHLGLVFESCRERNLLWTKIAPHLLRPVRFHMAFFSWSRTSRALVTLGLFLYDVLSLFRNPGGRGRCESRQALLRAGKPLDTKGLKGGLSYSDCACLDFRLVIDNLNDAKLHGGKALNYMEVGSIKLSHGAQQVRARDGISGREFSFQGKAVVNAAGAWADIVLGKSACDARFGLRNSRGIHLIFRRSDLPLQETFALENPRDGRNIYAVPWDGFVLVGTTDTAAPASPDELKVSEEEVDYLLEALNRYFPETALTREKVHAAYAGIRPLIGSDRNLKEEDLPRDYELHIDPRGLLSITGGKLTTARVMAKSAVDALIADFFRERPLGACSTDSPLPVLIPPAAISAPTLKDVEKIAEQEGVQRLEDLLCRRTSLFLFSDDRGRSFAREAAAVLGRKLGWSDEKIREEVDLYNDLIGKEGAFHP